MLAASSWILSADETEAHYHGLHALQGLEGVSNESALYPGSQRISEYLKDTYQGHRHRGAGASPACRQRAFLAPLRPQGGVAYPHSSVLTGAPVQDQCHPS